ncbi:DUF4214 domain-containing protein [Pseudoduganella sp. RAF53_2]|uniref:DUF4214 domain-containing protein n=1 Tax=unclassified Pseudoduganella TaxID=2637179 RepID=UPI003F95C101
MSDGIILGGTTADDVLRGTNGNDNIYGNGGHDQLIGLDGDDNLSSGQIYDAASGTYKPDTVGDILDGGNGNDTLTGGDGNDILIGGAGNDHLIGGNGLDTAQYSGNLNAYAVQENNGTLTVTGPEGTDTLNGVERLQFADHNMAFDLDGTAGIIYRFYQAALDRQPDLPGLGYWIHFADTGRSFTDIASGFTNSVEFQRLYGVNSDNATFVTALYHNALHREPEAAGFNDWMNRLATGTSREQVMFGFSESTENRAQVIGSIQHGIEYIPYSGS